MAKDDNPGFYPVDRYSVTWNWIWIWVLDVPIAFSYKVAVLLGHSQSWILSGVGYLCFSFSYYDWWYDYHEGSLIEGLTMTTWIGKSCYMQRWVSVRVTIVSIIIHDNGHITIGPYKLNHLAYSSDEGFIVVYTITECYVCIGGHRVVPMS